MLRRRLGRSAADVILRCGTVARLRLMFTTQRLDLSRAASNQRRASQTHSVHRGGFDATSGSVTRNVWRADVRGSVARRQTAKSADATHTAAAKPAAAAVVNINTATAAEFEALPGIGAKTAARIVEYRQKNGPFKKVEELMNVRGLGEKNFLKLKAQLTIGATKPADR
jgi:competence protein ComEA